CESGFCIGYAGLSAPRVTAIGGWAGLGRVRVWAAPTNWGWWGGGMPSLRGPPLLISLKDTLCLSKLVFQPSRLNPSTSGAAEGCLAAPPAGDPLLPPQAVTSSSTAPAAPAAAFAFIAPGGSAAPPAARRLAAA